MRKICTWILFREYIMRRLPASRYLAHVLSPAIVRFWPMERGKESESRRGKRGREGERGIQSGRACSADWYQWRQIELAGDRWSSPAVTRSYGSVHNVFPRSSFSPSYFHLDTSLLFLHRYPRGIVSSVPLHAIAIVTIPRPAHLHAPLWMRQAVTVRRKSIIC